MFIQLHTLTSYPASLLNRDDSGFAKRIPFGGTSRTRISSQCLKYHWRNHDGDFALGGSGAPRSLRSRETFGRKVAAPLINAGYPTSLVRAVVWVIKELVLTGKAPAASAVADLIVETNENTAWDQLQSSQVTVLGAPEIAYLKDLVQAQLDALRTDHGAFWEDGADRKLASSAAASIVAIATGDLKKNLQGLQLASGLDAAMFGRMVTSDVLSRGDAAIHVAHAFTTHEEETESDYFSAVDELRRDEPGASGEMGAGHINSQEVTSGVYYSYVVVDVPLLVSNLEGTRRENWTAADRALAANVVSRLVHIITTVSPGAKLGSTAPHAYAQFVLAEVGTAQPRTLANAFHHAIPTRSGSVQARSIDALAAHVTSFDRMYGNQTARRVAGLELSPDHLASLGLGNASSVPDIASWLSEQILQAP